MIFVSFILARVSHSRYIFLNTFSRSHHNLGIRLSNKEEISTYHIVIRLLSNIIIFYTKFRNFCDIWYSLDGAYQQWHQKRDYFGLIFIYLQNMIDRGMTWSRTSTGVTRWSPWLLHFEINVRIKPLSLLFVYWYLVYKMYEFYGRCPIDFVFSHDGRSWDPTLEPMSRWNDCAPT